MTDGTRMPGGAGAPQTTDLTTLLDALARLVGEAEELVAGAPRATSDGAAQLAGQQAAIIAAAHQEAAAILAAAHSAAALVLDRAATGHPTPDSASPVSSELAGSVVDLRDATLAADEVLTDEVLTDDAPTMDAAPAPPPPPAPTAPVTHAAPVRAERPAAGEDDEADLRASLAAAIDMARGLSERIDQLTQGLHETPAP